MRSDYDVIMKVDLVRIGNSRGIRIPKPLIEQCGLGETVDLSIRARPHRNRARRPAAQGLDRRFPETPKQHPMTNSCSMAQPGNSITRNGSGESRTPARLSLAGESRSRRSLRNQENAPLRGDLTRRSQSVAAHGNRSAHDFRGSLLSHSRQVAVPRHPPPDRTRSDPHRRSFAPRPQIGISHYEDGTRRFQSADRDVQAASRHFFVVAANSRAE